MHQEICLNHSLCQPDTSWYSIFRASRLPRTQMCGCFRPLCCTPSTHLKTHMAKQRKRDTYKYDFVMLTVEFYVVESPITLTGARGCTSANSIAMDTSD